MLNRLKELRQRIPLTQTELAEAVGTTPQTIQRLESGKINISVEWARRLAPVLSVDPAYLLGWDTPVDTPQDEKDLLDTYRQLPLVMQYSTLALMAAMVADYPPASESTKKHFKAIRDRYSGLAGHNDPKEKGGS